MAPLCRHAFCTAILSTKLIHFHHTHQPFLLKYAAFAEFYANFFQNDLHKQKKVVPLQRNYESKAPRGVAQLVSAPALGAGGPKFESWYPDKKKTLNFSASFFCFYPPAPHQPHQTSPTPPHTLADRRHNAKLPQKQSKLYKKVNPRLHIGDCLTN